MTVTQEVWTLVVGILSILFGILVIVRPKVLAYIVGVYLIVVGILALVRFFL